MAPQPFQIDKRAHQLRKLTEVSRALTYAVSLNDVLELTVTRAGELLAASRVVLLLADDDGLLSVRASLGLDAAASDFKERLQETLIQRLHNLLKTSETEEFLGVPLVVGGEVTGMLAVARQAGEIAPDEAEWLLSALADQAAVALEKTRLDETAEFRERLIGIVSHDLRNPVSAILMIAANLRRWRQLDPQTMDKLVDRIQSSSDRAASMIRDLLDFTQARLGGGIPIGRKQADLHAIVRQVAEETEIAHPERKIVVSHEGDAAGFWDSDRLAQVVGNLLSNAIAYSPADTPIRLSTRGHHDGVALVVHNTGDAIPPAQMPHLFEPMQRAAADLSNRSRSVGLGLYIVKHIVDSHRGRVEVRSSSEEGTTLTVDLPRR